ncbi:MAG TPA: helix-turn-helix domain-containing protein [Steroidobacteraceae bacterium]|nr:helix-turn-helix domain-containing protein [Steroidobacteraceae bacterium]
MHEAKRNGCELCGLFRICFPGRVASASERRSGGLHIRRMRVPRGKALYRSGDKVESFYMIRSGCIKELDDSSGRHGTLINFALPGEMLSLQSLGNALSNTTSIAVEPSFICVVPWAAFNQLCAESPRVAAEFIRLIAKAGTVARDLLCLIRDKEALERVSGFLLNVSGRLQASGSRGREFRLAMNRDDIANYLGLRSETVSRCFTELARRQLIKVQAKRVHILHAADLRKVFLNA